MYKFILSHFNTKLSYLTIVLLSCLSVSLHSQIDTDMDGISDKFDNCPFVINQDQNNFDGDKDGDACDSLFQIALYSDIIDQALNTSSLISEAKGHVTNINLNKPDIVLIQYQFENPSKLNSGFFYLKINGLITHKQAINYVDSMIIFELGLQEKKELFIELIAVSSEPSVISLKSIKVMADYNHLANTMMNMAASVPNEFDMLQNEPNPFIGGITIPFQVPVKTNVKIVIYKDSKTPIATVVDKEFFPGYHFVRWDASQHHETLPNGQYLYSIEAGDFKYAKKMILLKH